MNANQQLINRPPVGSVFRDAFFRAALLCFLLLGAVPSAKALNQEIWTLYQQMTIARLDPVSGTWINFGSGMIDPARPSDPPGTGWTTIGIAPDRTLFLMRRNQATGGIWLYSVPADNIVVTANNVTNLQLVGSTGLAGNVDGLTVGPDGNVYFTAYALTSGAHPNGLYRYRLGSHTVEFVGTFASTGGAGGVNSFYTDLAFVPGPNGDLVGQGKGPSNAFGLYRIPRTTALNGINLTFPWTSFSSVVLTTGRIDGIAFDPTNGNLFLGQDALGVSRVDAQGANPVLIAGTSPFLGWDLANQVEGCSETRPIRTLCVPGTAGDYTFTFEITNHSGLTAYSWQIPDVPPFTVSPHTQPLNPPLPVNGTRQITITIHGAAAGQQVCLLGVFLDETGQECCKFQVCATIPKCECLQIYRDFPPHCTGLFNGSFTYTFQIQNLAPDLLGHMFIESPPGVSISPDYFPLSPPIAPNGGIDASLRTLTITGATPGSHLCFDITIHDPDLNECCTKQVCIDVPYCRSHWWDDIGFVTDVGVGAGGADVSRTPEHVATAGFAADARLSSPALVADRFTIAQPTAIEAISIPAYVERSGTAEPFDFLSIEIWDGPPNVATSRRVYGDINTNVLLDSSPSGVYRVLHDEPLMSDRRPNWFANAALGHVVVLQPGTYWLVWSLGSPLGTPMQPYKVTTTAVQAGEALQRLDGTWRRASAGEAWPNGTELPFLLRLSVLPSSDDIVLNTGYDQVLDAALLPGSLPTGTNDDHWQVVSPGIERPAKVVIDPHPNWPQPLPNSQWISVDPNRGTSLPGVSQIVFQRCFCLGDEPGEVTIDLQLRADNEAVVSLNDHLLAGPGAAFAGPPLAVRRTGSVGDGLFVSGRNCVKVEVHDFGFFMGLNLAGTVKAPEGECEP